MTTMTTDTTPRVWIGCLACYNAGWLVGDWYDAEEADRITPDVLHFNHTTDWDDSHEEMWVMDTDNMPVSREMSPSEAAEWGRLLSDVDEWQRDALAAWVRSGDYIAEGRGDLPSLPDFEERYVGEYESFREYAEQYVEDMGILDASPTVAQYFDYDAFARDLAHDYTTEPANGGGVYVFRSL